MKMGELKCGSQVTKVAKIDFLSLRLYGKLM
jgi:hypothetical protein